ncbi:MAG: hypothetical protein CFE26_11505 [Verrucomicrobiales bacterium VVV1]|nr:MAG: hypothetical protein CFE26_11505 [Verrucomicrobiales bacterium VVV1]
MRDLQSYVDEEFQKTPQEAMRLYDGKTVEEVFPHLLKSQLESRLKKLESGRRAMLQERSRYIANIQNGTYLMWKEGLDQLEQFIALNLAWGTRLIKEFKTNGDPERRLRFHALIQNHSRACLMSEEILHLLKGGFPDAAFARWRSLYEIAVTATFIGLNGEACAEAYLDHEIVDELKCHQLDHELQAARGIKLHADCCLKDLEREFQEMLVKHGDSFKNQFGWASAALGHKNPQFRDLEEGIGQDHMRVTYKRASHKIHAAANGISTSLGTQSFGLNAPMLRAPSHEGLGDPAIYCARSLSQTSAAITTLFPNAECLIEMNLFAELVRRIERAFDRVSEG